MRRGNLTREERNRARRTRREGTVLLTAILLACWLPGWVDMLFTHAGL